jgi:hypothetical protein
VKKCDPIQKQTEEKRTRGLVQVVECFPIKCQVLCSVPLMKTKENKQNVLDFEDHTDSVAQLFN